MNQLQEIESIKAEIAQLSKIIYQRKQRLYELQKHFNPIRGIVDAHGDIVQHPQEELEQEQNRGYGGC